MENDRLSNAESANTLKAENIRLRDRVDKLEALNADLKSELVAMSIEHQHTEEALLHLNEELQYKAEQLRIFKLLVDNAPDAIAVADTSGTPGYMNPAFQQQHGISEADPEGMQIMELLAPEEHDRIRNQILPQMMQDGFWVGRLIRQRLNGDTFPVHMAGFVIRNHEGETQALASISRDITQELQQEQRLVEQRTELQHHQAVLQGFLDHLPAAMFVRDTEGRYIVINKYYTALVNRDTEQIIGKTPHDLLPPDSADIFLENDRKVLEAGSPITREETSSMGTYLAIKFPIFNTEGTITAIGGISTDISHKKQLEQELQLFKLIADNAPDAIGIADTQGVITYANTAYGTMTGYGDAMIGMKASDIIVEEERQMIEQGTTTILERGAWQGIVTFRRKDGSTLQGEASRFVVYDTNHQPLAFAAIVRDLTEQQRAEEERAALQQQIIDAQRSAISELSTPLLPLSDSVVAMPLVGTLDSNRAQQVMETLLEGIAANDATTAIVDITGIKVVDTQVAQALLNTAQAVRLLGAQVIVTGIQPQIAQTLVQLGADLHHIVTRRTLQDGIAYALHTGR